MTNMLDITGHKHLNTLHNSCHGRWWWAIWLTHQFVRLASVTFTMRIDYKGLINTININTSYHTFSCDVCQILYRSKFTIRCSVYVEYIPRNISMVHILLCFVEGKLWLILCISFRITLLTLGHSYAIMVDPVPRKQPLRTQVDISDIWWRFWIMSQLYLKLTVVQIMACRLDGAKPLSEPMLVASTVPIDGLALFKANTSDTAMTKLGTCLCTSTSMGNVLLVDLFLGRVDRIGFICAHQKQKQTF